MNINELIKRETTPHIEILWGEEYHNIKGELINKIHGDGKLLIYLVPLATRPDYYIMRVDSSVEKLIEDDDDEIRELVDVEFLSEIEDEFGKHENGDDENPYYEPFPALNDSCGCSWGKIT